MATKKEKAVQAEINIGMIGHVDHGKTSITKALTGMWTDTHSEELKRGISIRLGYADASFYKCGTCKGAEAYGASEKCSCKKKAKFLRTVSFIDAPGHETLMSTMLSGAVLMQGAILVIAANEPCPQPRTEEHLLALKMSKVKNIVVAQNKVDLVDKKKAIENYKQIVKFLEQYGYKDAPIIPTAANFGTNVDLLIEAIEAAIPSPKHESKKPLKMFVVRSFDVNKPGIDPKKLKGGVVGGSIMQGEVKLGGEIERSPGLNGKPILTKCESINYFSGTLDKAGPGGLIAIGTKLDPYVTRNDHMRGQVLAKPGSIAAPTKKLTLEIHYLERLVEKIEPGLKPNENIVFTIGTMTNVGRMSRKLAGKDYEVILNAHAVVENGQKVAISKRVNMQWRLVAYGICK